MGRADSVKAVKQAAGSNPRQGGKERGKTMKETKNEKARQSANRIHARNWANWAKMTEAQRAEVKSMMRSGQTLHNALWLVGLGVWERPRPIRILRVHDNLTGETYEVEGD